jgi:hypothetical protein
MASNPNPIQQNDAPQAAPAQAAPDAQAPAQAQAPAPQPQQSDDANTSTGAQSTDASLPTDGSKESVNLHRDFNNLQERLAEFGEAMAIPRSLTLPHVPGQDFSEHISNVQQALSDRGGLTSNVLVASHSKYGKGGGATIGFSGDKLRSAIIPKEFASARSAISAASHFVSDAAKLIGDNAKSIQIAKSQLALIGKHSGQGMSALDFIVALQHVLSPVTQEVGRDHSGTKEGGHSAKRRLPRK